MLSARAFEQSSTQFVGLRAAATYSLVAASIIEMA
jgi:hypothetical protein